MFTSIAIGASVLGVIVLVVVAFVQRGKEGIDLSPRTLLRAYLYAASFAGLVALVVGLASLLNWGIATTAGPQVVYGGTPVPAIVRKCPPGATGCVEPTPEEIAQMERQQNDQRKRQVGEELLRGLTFTVIGSVFYGAHYMARRSVIGSDEARSALRRAYLMFGTVVFGLATIVLVPTGLYQLLANAILESPQDVYRSGIQDTFAPGVVSLVVWLIFLRLVVSETRLTRTEA